MKNKISHKVNGMEYEDLPPSNSKMSTVTYRINKSAFKKKIKKPGIIKIYCDYLVEVILA